ncbi:hypothetical protein MSAN_02509900 [Mycena sanguinolenta]|uniref:Uncharacterized protein n=1 Tax=Mycena sanguinolenta TaxID=230812 RepID=A0A8H6U1A1_9AGAR|nr:hypothetical protein MSAN_02509900 [Mycena sanguinolenta]
MNPQCPSSHVKLEEPNYGVPAPLFFDSMPIVSRPFAKRGRNPGLGRVLPARPGDYTTQAATTCIMPTASGLSSTPDRSAVPPDARSTAFPEKRRISVSLGATRISSSSGTENRIDKIPVHSSLYISDGDSVLLSTEAIISAVETFLDERGFALPGLSMRVHFPRRPFRVGDFFMSPPRFVALRQVTLTRHTAVSRSSRAALAGVHPAPRPRLFSVDLHTAHAPIVACGCTPIQRLFGSSSESPPSERTPHVNTLWLYAVRRKTESTSADSDAVEKRGTVSKESAYLSDAAWQPSVVQTPRGMAALLSSLYIFSHSVAQKGIAAEQKGSCDRVCCASFPACYQDLGWIAI